LFGIKNEQELDKALKQIHQNGILVVPFFESDRNGEMTAFATQPIFENQRHLFRRYNCLSNNSFRLFKETQNV
jgi:hypothetical protein